MRTAPATASALGLMLATAWLITARNPRPWLRATSAHTRAQPAAPASSQLSIAPQSTVSGPRAATSATGS